MRPNTVLLGWPGSEATAESFGRHLRVISMLGCSIVAARFEGASSAESGILVTGRQQPADAGTLGPAASPEADAPDEVPAEDPWAVPEGTIDVWWRGARNGALMLLFAHLLRQNRRWRNRPIRLIRVIESESGRGEVERHLSELVHAARIEAETVVFVHDDPGTVIREQSAQAAVALVGFTPPETGKETEFYLRLQSLVGDLPRVLFVHSVGPIALEA